MYSGAILPLDMLKNPRSFILVSVSLREGIQISKKMQRQIDFHYEIVVPPGLTIILALIFTGLCAAISLWNVGDLHLLLDIVLFGALPFLITVFGLRAWLKRHPNSHII